MIEFLTLFLGLVTGEQRIELSVGEEVARVEIRLDQRSLGSLDGEPWIWAGDFGAALSPHELVAIARDDEGRELSRARQWLNLPRDRAEARFRLEHEAESSPPIARLWWQALDHDRPRSIEITFDGKRLAADDPERIVLPPHDPRTLHFLRAELIFSDTVQTQAELVFGGTYGDEVQSELTALVVQAKSKRPPKAEEMDGWFVKRGEPLRVVAAERGNVDLLVVREPSVRLWDALKNLRLRHLGAVHPRARFSTVTILPSRADRSILPGRIDRDDRVRFVFTQASESDRQNFAIHLLPQSGNLIQQADGTLFGILTEVFYEDLDATVPEHRLTDAVAIAGLLAAASDRRRAVLLLRTGDGADQSQLKPSAVRSYLADLQVPLYHWPLAPKGETLPTSAWGDEATLDDLGEIKKALKTLHQELDHQWVVWVVGAHLPHEVELSGEARGIELLR